MLLGRWRRGPRLKSQDQRIPAPLVTRAAVDARDRLSDSVHVRAPAVCKARSVARCVSSILKPLWASGRASANDLAIADFSESLSSSEAPRSAASAAVRRHGLCATPPTARRADSILLPLIDTAAATDTSANS